MEAPIRKTRIVAKVYKALMVEKETHKKVIVKAKQKDMTVTQFINNLLKGNDK